MLDLVKKAGVLADYLVMTQTSMSVCIAIEWVRNMEKYMGEGDGEEIRGLGYG